MICRRRRNSGCWSRCAHRCCRNWSDLSDSRWCRYRDTDLGSRTMSGRLGKGMRKRNSPGRDRAGRFGLLCTTGRRSRSVDHPGAGSCRCSRPVVRCRGLRWNSRYCRSKSRDRGSIDRYSRFRTPPDSIDRHSRFRTALGMRCRRLRSYYYRYSCQCKNRCSRPVQPDRRGCSIRSSPDLFGCLRIESCRIPPHSGTRMSRSRTLLWWGSRPRCFRRCKDWSRLGTESKTQGREGCRLLLRAGRRRCTAPGSPSRDIATNRGFPAGHQALPKSHQHIPADFPA